MAALSDVEMPERGPLSRSSSLSPPPSSTADENEIVDSRTTTRIDSPSRQSPHTDDLTIQKKSTALESASLPTPAESDAMVTTRGAARKAAANGSTDASPPARSERSPKMASSSSRTSTYVSPKSNSIPRPDNPDEADPLAAARPSRKRLTLNSGTSKSRSRKKKEWTAEQLLRDHRSPLAKTDIRVSLRPNSLFLSFCSYAPRLSYLRDSQSVC